MLDKTKIALVTTVASFDLYKKTATLFPKEIDKIVIDGSLGMYGVDSIKYMFEQLKSRHYDWIIMADEDVFFYDSEQVLELIAYMIENNYDVAGVRDGGVIQHRLHHPLVVNTFFSILNFKAIKAAYNWDEVVASQSVSATAETSLIDVDLPYSYSITSLMEPYYCFYFWLHRKGFRFLFLPTQNPVGDDAVTNIVLMPNGEKIALHTWYARSYNVNEQQTMRIDAYIRAFGIQTEIDLKEVIRFKKRFYNFYKNLKKRIKKVLGSK